MPVELVDAAPPRRAFRAMIAAGRASVHGDCHVKKQQDDSKDDDTSGGRLVAIFSALQAKVLTSHNGYNQQLVAEDGQNPTRSPTGTASGASIGCTIRRQR